MKSAVKYCSFEQGFILGCTSRLDRINAHKQISADQAGVFFYSPNVKEATEVVREWAEEGICFCGFMHSHRTGVREFSKADIQFAEKLMQNFQIPYRWFGLLVILERNIEIIFYKLYLENSKVVLELKNYIVEEKQ